MSRGLRQSLWTWREITREIDRLVRELRRDEWRLGVPDQILILRELRRRLRARMVPLKGRTR